MPGAPAPAAAARAVTSPRSRAATVHSMAVGLTRPEPTVYQRPEPRPAADATALVHFELERDPDDADYRPRIRLAA